MSDVEEISNLLKVNKNCEDLKGRTNIIKEFIRNGRID